MAIKVKPMTKKRLVQARSVLTREWRALFKNPTYDADKQHLYSDDRKHYLARAKDLLNPNGVSLFRV